MNDALAPDAAGDDRPWRPAASGASFVYVFPRPGEDILKLGMSRDPLERLQALHSRWYEFFDLDAGWLCETDRVCDARALELRLSRTLQGLRAPAPLTVAARAGGATEWFRGAAQSLDVHADDLAMAGHRLHRPLLPWLRQRMDEQAGLLFHWSSLLLEQLPPMRSAPAHETPPTPEEWKLRNGLDAFPALGLALESRVSPAVLAWWADSRRLFGQ
jgi:hypothetical protein